MPGHVLSDVMVPPTTHRQVDLLEKNETPRKRSTFLQDGQRIVARHVAGIHIHHELGWLAPGWHDHMLNMRATSLSVVKVDLECSRY